MSKELEQIMKDKFNQFEADVSPDLFDKIVAKKSRKGLIWLQWLKWSAAMLLLASVIGTAIYLSGGENDANNITTEKTLNNSGGASTKMESTSDQKSSEGQLAKKDVEVSVESGIDITQKDMVSSGLPGSVPQDDFTIKSEFNRTEEERNAFSQEQRQTDANFDANEVEAQDGDTKIAKGESKTNELVALENDEAPITNSVSTAEPESVEIPKVIDPIPTKVSMYSIDVLSGVGAAVWSSTTQAEANYLNKEKPAASAMIELALSRKWRNNWSLRAGLRYTELNYRFSNETLNQWSDTTINSKQVTIYHPVNPPQIITISDTSIEKISQVELTTANNRFRIISLPVELEKQFYFGNNWTVLGKIGTVLTLYDDQKGLRQITENETVKLEDQQSEVFGMLHATASVGLGYRFNSKVSCLFYPQYTFIPGKQNSSNTATHAVFGSLGLRIDL